jgi:peptidoglycan hydrolase-like protein with peptidoglycan-binding domain
VTKRWLAGALVATVAIAGCSGESGESSPQPATLSTGTSDRTAAASAAQSDSGGARLYFTSGEQFRPVERELSTPGSPLVSATKALVAGPTRSEQDLGVEPRTQIPDGVQVKTVTRSDDGTAVAELSPEFMQDIPAEPSERDPAEEADLNARLAQVTYTLTQFKGVDSAKVISGGTPVEPAQDRKDYQPPSDRAPRVVKSKGSATSGTQAVQQRLAQLRYLPKQAVDGLNGYRTQQAVIAFQSWQGLERDGIVGPATTVALATARVPKPKGSGPSRRIEVFRSKGVALVIRNDRTKRAIHVSTGVPAPATVTPAGTFEVFRKEVNSWSVPFRQWLPYASYFFQGIAFHEYASVPPYPASHGCVRVPAPEARFLYRFASIGTKVIVF